MNEPKLYRIKEFAHKHSWTSHASLSNCLQKADKNGLIEMGAFIRDDGKVFIDEDKFIDWVLTHAKNLKKTYLHYLSKRDRCA